MDEKRRIGNYYLLDRISAGGFGTVYRAKHVILDQDAAIKILRGYLSSEKERGRFIQEARLLASLRHPNILLIKDVGLGDPDDTPYLITEYAAGGSLRDLLEKTAPGLLDTQRTLTILTQIGQALDYIHQNNIIHCDLKPENILFNAQGEVLLADFGISHILSTATMKSLTSYEGSASYTAPEQFDQHACKESDQYALGCIAYELFTGQRVFLGHNLASLAYRHTTELPASPRTLNPDVPVHIEQAILKALAKGRKERHASARAFIDLLNTPSINRPLRDTSPISTPSINRPSTTISPINTPPAPTKEECFKAGTSLRNEGKYDEALAAYEEALRLDPTFAYAYNGKGNTLNELKRYQDALEAYEEALRLDPNYAHAYNNKGHALCKLNKFEEALEAFENALRFDPNFSLAYYGKGTALNGQRNYEEALISFGQALRLDTKFTDAYVGLGIALRHLHRDEEASKAFEQALQFDPNHALARHNKAEMVLLLTTPQSSKEWLKKGNVSRNAKRSQEALAAYEQALQLDSRNANAYYGKGNALCDLQRYDEALVAYEQALQLNPNYTQAATGRGNMLRTLKRYKEALAVFEQVLLIDPNANHAKSSKEAMQTMLKYEELLDKGQMLRNLKQYEDALAVYEQALLLMPNAAPAYIGKGDILDDLKRNAEALAVYEQALQFDANNADAYAGKGNALSHLRRNQEALEAFEQALRLDPNHVNAHASMGMAFHYLKRNQEALDSFEQALRIDPNSVLAIKNKNIVLNRINKNVVPPPRPKPINYNAW